MEMCFNFEDYRRNVFLDTKSNNTADKSNKKFCITELNGECNKAVIESWYEYQYAGEIPLIKIIMSLKSAHTSCQNYCQISRERWQGPAADGMF